MKNQYAGQEKSDARRTIWKHLSAAKGKALLLPHVRRVEMDTATQMGFKVEDLYFVDKSAAVLATFTKTLLPSERHLTSGHRRAAEVSAACSEWASAGVKLSAAHLDFCGNYSKPTRDQLSVFLKCGIFFTGRLAVTLMAARELEPLGRTREELLVSFLEQTVGPRRKFKLVVSGDYYNLDTRSPMMWIVGDVTI